MGVIAWNDRYATGIPAIDRQHQSLFVALAQLHEAFREGRGRAEVGKILDFLVKYVQIHFADEEAYMRRIQYPELMAHIEEHRKLTARVMDLHERHASGEVSASMETSVLLFEWLRDHIMVHDLAYVDHALATGQF